jgi:probable HAF family extracellular repeat protein
MKAFCLAVFLWAPVIFAGTDTPLFPDSIWVYPDPALYIVIVDKAPGRAYGVNDAGAVAGTLSDGLEAWPFKWESPTFQGHSIDTFGDGLGGGIYDINRFGQMVGWSENPEGEMKACRWMDKALNDIAPASPGEAGGYAVNDDGMMVGYAMTPKPHPAMWAKWKGWNLDGLGPEPGCALGINSPGVTVGKALFGEQTRACMWTLGSDAGTMWLPQSMLPIFNGSEAYGISDAGVIVGRMGNGLDLRPVSYDYDGNQPSQAYEWDFDSSMPLPLEPLDGSQVNRGCAYAVNLAGEIVGYSTASDGTQRACIWSPGHRHVSDLNTVGSGSFALASVKDISDFGTIVGWAKKEGTEYPAMLIPKQQYRLILSDRSQPGSEQVYSAQYQIEKKKKEAEEAMAYVPSGITTQGSNHELEEVSFAYRMLYPYGITFAAAKPGYVIDKVTRTGDNGIPKTLATSYYRDADADGMGGIEEIELACVDTGQPPLVVQCQYDPGTNVTKKIVGAKKGNPDLFNFLVEIEGVTRIAGGGMTNDRPQHVRISSATAPQLDIEMTAQYDPEGNIRILNRREADHIGNYICSYDPQGRILLLCYGLDDDCDGVVEEKKMEAVFFYDAEGKLERIADHITGQDLFRRDIVIDVPPKKKEEMILRPYIGEDIVETMAVTITDDDVDQKKKMVYEVESTPQLELHVPYDPAQPVLVQNVNWWGDLSASQRQAKIMWGTYYPEFGQSALLNNSIITPILNDAGKLAMTMSSDRISICLYNSRARKSGILAYRDGSTGMEIHLYQRDSKGKTTAMLTIDLDGQVVIGFASGAGPELASSQYMHSWPCQKVGKKKEAVVPPDAWNSTNNPCRFVIPDRAADGSLYIAGLVTPGGQFQYCEYRDNDCDAIQEIIKLNSPVQYDCPQKPSADLNGDCRVNLADLAIMAEQWMACARNPIEACAGN